MKGNREVLDEVEICHLVELKEQGINTLFLLDKTDLNCKLLHSPNFLSYYFFKVRGLNGQNRDSKKLNN